MVNPHAVLVIGRISSHLIGGFISCMIEDTNEYTHEVTVRGKKLDDYPFWKNEEDDAANEDPRAEFEHGENGDVEYC